MYLYFIYQHLFCLPAESCTDKMWSCDRHHQMIRQASSDVCLMLTTIGTTSIYVLTIPVILADFLSCRRRVFVVSTCAPSCQLVPQWIDLNPIVPTFSSSCRPVTRRVDPFTVVSTCSSSCRPFLVVPTSTRRGDLIPFVLTCSPSCRPVKCSADLLHVENP